MISNVEIGKRIERARNLRGLTHETIGAKVGVAKSTVQRYEKGKIENIKLPVVQSIAMALSVNPLWIIGKSDEMETKNDNSSNYPTTVAAHLDTGDLTEDELDDVANYIELVKKRRNK